MKIQIFCPFDNILAQYSKIYNKENQDCNIFLIAGMRDTLKVFCMFTDKIEKKVQEKYNEMFKES